MHELSLTQGIVTICLQHAQGKRVTAVTVEIGLLGSVVPEAVEFCFLHAVPEHCSKMRVL